jgi:hypothetical protein
MRLELIRTSDITNAHDSTNSVHILITTIIRVEYENRPASVCVADVDVIHIRSRLIIEAIVSL